MLSITWILIMKIVTILALTCDEILELPTDQKITLLDLQTVPPKDIVQCLGHFGKEKLPPAEADFIWKSIITFYDGVQFVPDSDLMILHWVTPAVSPMDYENMTLSDIDVIQNFGLNYNLNQEQLTAIANRVREGFAQKDPEDYTYYDLTALRQILCAFNRSEIERIPPLAYREAALLIGKLEQCNADVLAGFATLAIQKSAFGSPENWTDATIKIVGKVADYLAKK